MADDNIFDFEAFKKKLEELKNQHKEKASVTGQDAFLRILQMYSSLLPSQEEVDKAISGLAESLEQTAKNLREMQKKKKDDKGEEEYG